MAGLLPGRNVAAAEDNEDEGREMEVKERRINK